MSSVSTNHFILIDDNEIDLLLHHKIIELTLPNAIISRFSSAESALFFLKNSSPPESYILFLDIKMPVMDGFQFLDIFSGLNQELIRSTKIYLLSSSTNQFDISRANNNPLVLEMITKPLSKDVLLRVLTS